MTVLKFKSFLFEVQILNFVLYSRLAFRYCANGHSHNVVSKLPDIVKLKVKIYSTALTLSSVVNINPEIDNVDLTLFNIVNSNVTYTTLLQRPCDVVQHYKF